jgi:hypothetical protein
MDRFLHRVLAALCAAVIFIAANAYVQAAPCAEHDHGSTYHAMMTSMDDHSQMNDHQHSPGRSHDGAGGSHAQICCQANCNFYAPMTASAAQPSFKTTLSSLAPNGVELMPPGVGVPPDFDPPKLSA